MLACVLAVGACDSGSSRSRPTAGSSYEQQRLPPRPAAQSDRVRRTRTGFVPPSASERSAAIGPLADFDMRATRAFEITQAFAPLARPEPGEWLAEHHESGQTHRRYVKSRPNLPKGKRRVIYLLPLGKHRHPASPKLATLSRYARAYFGLPARVLEPVVEFRASVRVHRRSKRQQLSADDILHWLPSRLPDDAYCLLAITERDLFSGPRSDFLFGKASYRERVGVFSLARYRPSFHGVKVDPATERRIVLRRSLTPMTHEIGHMFGMHHCVYFRCHMNGMNSLREVDSAPLHSCPVCLRKLHHAVGFVPVDRYRRLRRFYRRVGLDAEARWAAGRVRWLRASQ